MLPNNRATSFIIAETFRINQNYQNSIFENSKLGNNPLLSSNIPKTNTFTALIVDLTLS